MRRITICCLAVLVLGLTPGPASSDPGGFHADEHAMRFVPRPAGVEKEMSFYFGPFVIPGGQDLNRITLDLPVHGATVTAIAPDLVDVATGLRPSNQHMHIHHAHWLRITNDPEAEYYTSLGDGLGGLSWVFGTGEERTQGSLDDRAAAELGGPRYGIHIPGGQPQALIYMLHNKDATPAVVFVTLKVRFVYGTPDEIKAAAPGCGGILLEGETCAAGDDFHLLTGKLWGTTFDVPRQADGDGLYIHPADIPANWSSRRATDHLGRFFTAKWDATAVAGAGHLHPAGTAVVVANLGPEGSGCEADVDLDGFPGATLFRSDKIEHVPADYLSEDYQMGATQAAFRAPVRAGDRITQFGVYSNLDHATYEAMSFTGIYFDKLQTPGARTGNCLADLSPYLTSGGGDPTATVLNHAWDHDPDPLCGLAGYGACNRLEPDRGEGMVTDTVHIANFLYMPGDRALSGQMGALPKVQQGTSLRFVNDDVGLLVRHTITSCPWPCNGEYVANYPLPDGAFDSGKIGNLDYIDGGITGDDTSPVWQSPTTLEVGAYSYYCRIHPWMRGAFEVVA